MALVSLFVLCVVIVFPGQCLGAANPPLGECCHYKWGGFGIIKLHFYVCCNNCDENDGDPECGGTVYDKASDKPYCGPCGEDQGNARGKIGGSFDCGGCVGQNQVKAECDKKHRWVFKGFCWVWSTCFSLRCRKRFLAAAGDQAVQALQGGSYDDEAFCGDDKCDPGEDHESCPFDCCPRYNPEKCKRSYCDKCPPPCCAESSCCIHSES
ncbi:uncharacterized protein LOC144884943 [Branchiostoma floridae x Branchiostoma japonicum]